MTISQKLKKIFVEDVDSIYWRNKLAPSTVNIAEGKYVNELQVFEVNLKNPNIDEEFFYQIDKFIPYYIAYVLEYNAKYQIWIGYKESMLNKDSYKVDCYYHTDWISKEEILFKLDGLTLDDVYENFVRKVANGRLNKKNDNESLKDSVEIDRKKQQLESKIEKLNLKIKREKQFNKQVELSSELKKLKNELENL